MKELVSNLKYSSLKNAPQALLRAADKARLLAEQTGTPLVVRQQGTSSATAKSK
jgi:hypothetical protein